MPHSLPPLPYAHDALEPTIDAKTISKKFSIPRVTLLNDLVAVGLVLVWVASFLARKVKSLLLGESAEPEGAPAEFKSENPMYKDADAALNEARMNMGDAAYRAIIRMIRSACRASILRPKCGTLPSMGWLSR